MLWRIVFVLSGETNWSPFEDGAMADDAVVISSDDEIVISSDDEPPAAAAADYSGTSDDYSGTSDSDSESESDKVPSRLPAPAGSCMFAHELASSVLHAGCGCAPSPEKNSIAVCDAT